MSDDKSSIDKVPEKPVLEILEEDDEFEEFGTSLGKNTSMSGNAKGSEGKSGSMEPQWEDDWDDDNTDDQFTAKLREELKKRK